MKGEHQIVRIEYCDDCENGTHNGVHYFCKKIDCFFESDDLSDVAQHVVENQFTVK